MNTMTYRLTPTGIEARVYDEEEGHSWRDVTYESEQISALIEIINDLVNEVGALKRRLSSAERHLPQEGDY